MDAGAANDIIKDDNLTAVTILDCLNILLEISEQNRDFRRAVVVLMAKVKKHQASQREENTEDDNYSGDDDHYDSALDD